MAAWYTWHRLVRAIPRKKGKKNLIYVPLLGGFFPLLTSPGLRDAGNKHCPEDGRLIGVCEMESTERVGSLSKKYK